METRAKLRYLRMSPRKVRLVVDLVRKLPVEEALEQLRFCNKRAARPVIKLINSAIANAEHNYQLKKDNLFIKEIKVDQGPALKRWRARAMGRAAIIKKLTSHVTVVLAEIDPTSDKSAAKDKKDKSAKKSAAQQSVKVVKSLDEVKEQSEQDSSEGGPTKSSQSTKAEQTKNQSAAKRKIFNRKVG